jgi:hypothetical protein
MTPPGHSCLVRAATFPVALREQVGAVLSPDRSARYPSLFSVGSLLAAQAGAPPM